MKKKLIVSLASFCTFILAAYSSQLLTESTWLTSSFAYLFSHNFNEVVPGQLYRSGELDETELKIYISKYGIKTVVDLRKGGESKEKYGFSEKRLAESLGVNYKWIPLVGTNTHQSQSLKQIIKTSENSEAPVLIHCSSGTHRSGVATAIWLMNRQDESPIAASSQLSPKYGYFYWERKLKGWFMGHETLDAVIWNYLKAYKQTGIQFKEWFKTNSKNL